MRFVVFELWDRKDGQLAAANFAYVVGSVLHDYTFLTLKRDGRSCGSILTRVVGHIIESCGFDLWYWGFKLEYMKEYDKYGGKGVPRRELMQVLKHSHSQLGGGGGGKGATNSRKDNGMKGSIVNVHNEPVLDVVEFVKAGKALVQPLPEWLQAEANS